MPELSGLSEKREDGQHHHSVDRSNDPPDEMPSPLQNQPRDDDDDNRPVLPFPFLFGR